MRAAPAVSVRCVSGAGWRSVQSALGAATAAVSVYWLLSRAEVPWVSAAGATVGAALAAAWAVWRPRTPGAVDLAWDGRGWTADGTAGQLDVMIDLQGWLLLRLRPAAGGAPRWIPVSAAATGSALHGLRAAAYAAVADDSIDDAASAAPGRSRD